MEGPFMNMPGISQPTASEKDVIAAARASRSQCTCGEFHDDQSPVPCATAGRMRGYLAAHPGHQFAIDEDGTLAVIALRESGPPQVLAVSRDLEELLDIVGAPGAGTLS